MAGQALNHTHTPSGYTAPHKLPAECSDGIHVYMGTSCRGVTTFRFVTDTHRHLDKHTNPKTQQVYKGVGSKEYNDVLQQHLIPEGKRLFQHYGR